MTHTAVVPAKPSMYKRFLPLAVLLAGIVAFLPWGSTSTSISTPCVSIGRAYKPGCKPMALWRR